MPGAQAMARREFDDRSSLDSLGESSEECFESPTSLVIARASSELRMLSTGATTRGVMPRSGILPSSPAASRDVEWASGLATGAACYVNEKLEASGLRYEDLDAAEEAEYPARYRTAISAYVLAGVREIERAKAARASDPAA